MSLKDQLRSIVGKFDSRTRKNKAQLNREALVGILRSDDADGLTKVFGDRADLFEGFMENAAERKRDGIDPDDHKALRRKKGDNGEREMKCDQEDAQDEEDTKEYEEASDTEAHNEYEQEDPDKEDRDSDGEQHQQHLDDWQSNHPHYQYDDL